MRFNNRYEDIYGNMVDLTEEELNWFYGIVAKFQMLEEAKGIEIVNRNHEKLSGKSREALGQFYTDDPKDEKADCFITIDNYFIHEQFEWVFNGKYNLAFETSARIYTKTFRANMEFRNYRPIGGW